MGKCHAGYGRQHHTCHCYYKCNCWGAHCGRGHEDPCWQAEELQGKHRSSYCTQFNYLSACAANFQFQALCFLVQVLFTFKLCCNKHESYVLQATFILKHVTNPKAKRLLNAISPGEPSPKCAACGTARLELQIDAAKTTLDDLLNKVIMEAELSVAPMWTFTTQLFLVLTAPL